MKDFVLFTLLIFKIAFLVPSLSHAETSIGDNQYYNHKAEGWYWYETKQEKEKKEKFKKEKNEVLPMMEQIPRLEPQEGKSSREIVLNYKEQLENAHYDAMILRTPEAMERWVAMNKHMMDTAEDVANKRMAVIYTNPTYDETVGNPVTQAARKTFLAERTKREQEEIKGLAQKYALMFFYSSSCPHCHQMAPIVKDFSEKYGWTVLPISADGGGLQEFPDYDVNQGQAEALGITHVPALVLANPSEKKMIKISSDIMTQDMLEERLTLLIQTKRITP